MFLTIIEKLKNNPLVKWYRNILLSFDYMINALTLGDPRETLSSVFGKMKQDGTCMLCVYLCKALSVIMLDPDHCKKAIIPQYGRNSDNDMSPIPGLRRKWSNGFVILIGVMFFYQAEVFAFLEKIITTGLGSL